ncbi:MAG: AAA family ATPase [Spirochaetales bacterium]|nr:AAA family ATPase [Spirochaetales bacterium]
MLLVNLEKVIRGKLTCLEYLVTGLIAGGHILIEDVPGLGKTTLAKTLAHLISRTKKGQPVIFKRIQFTPDLLPYDITGVDIYDPHSNQFIFSPGPAFANILLADEINRTTPKVQSALLEVMAENQVTVGNKTHKMDPFFFVIATQNPVETEGTYPLPLAQIDRFLMKLHIGYPSEEIEIGIVKDDPSLNVMPKIVPVCGKDDILHIRDAVAKVHCDDRLIKVIVSVVSATRNYRGIELGASPRASLMLLKAARAYALVKGRGYVIDQDVIDLAPLVVAHRLRLKAIKLNPEVLIRDMVMDALTRITY